VLFISISKVLLSPANSKKPVKLSPSIASDLNKLLEPIWLISNVILTPSKSRAVMVPDVADVPPIRLDDPNCSKSIVAEFPT